MKRNTYGLCVQRLPPVKFVVAGVKFTACVERSSSAVIAMNLCERTSGTINPGWRETMLAQVHTRINLVTPPTRQRVLCLFRNPPAALLSSGSLAQH